MDRRSKIIVSVVGIFIVLLALIGITYAYFLTRVEGNTNDTSISITTANLRIVYDDNNSQINATNIQPSKTEFYSKTFTVTNTGNETSSYEVYLENVINDFVHEEDLLMFITCESSIADNECNGYGSGSVSNGVPTFGESIYPLTNAKLISNTIEPAPDADLDGEVHTYTLYLRFLDDDSDQGDDMGKILQGKVQIYDPKDVVSISGMLTGYEEGYYVQLQSETKTSELKYEKTVDGTKYYSYVFYGVEPETDAHTLSIMKKGNETPIVQKSIMVTKGTDARVENITGSIPTITISNDTETIMLDINVTEDGIGLTNNGIYGINRFNEGTLAYKILDKALNATGTNETKYLENTLSTPVKEISKTLYSKGNDPEEFETDSIFTFYYYVYADDYKVNAETGKFSLINPQVGQYSSNYTNIRGKYALQESGSCFVPGYYKESSAIENANEEYESECLYKIGEESTNSVVYYAQVYPNMMGVERTLSRIPDMYTNETRIDSYYFRGAVKDNYVLFNNMCFRIVRIEGDGSVKLFYSGDVGNGATDCTGLTESSALLTSLDGSDVMNYGDSCKNFEVEKEGELVSIFMCYPYFNSDLTNEDILEDSLYYNLNAWFNSKFKINNELTTNGQKLKSDTWCLGYNEDVYYESYVDTPLTKEQYKQQLIEYNGYGEFGSTAGKRIMYDKIASLKCEEEETFDSYVATLNIDEVILAGATLDSRNMDFYIRENADLRYSKPYDYLPVYNLISVGKFGDGSVFPYRLYNDGRLDDFGDYLSSHYRPAITLKNTTQYVSGNGTIESPYIIN